MDNVHIKQCKRCGRDYVPRHDKDIRCLDCYSHIGRNSKSKGASNERRFFSKLQALFDSYGLKYKVRRTPRSGSIHEFECSDGLFSGLPASSVFKAHWELKNTGQWAIEDWYKEAVRKEQETGNNRPPIIVARHPNSSNEFMILEASYGSKLLIENELNRHETTK